MTAESATIDLKKTQAFGAVEIKQFIKKHTWLAFVITVAALVLLIILNVVIKQISKASEAEFAGLRRAPIVKLTLEQLQQPDQAENLPPPPSQTIVTPGLAAAAGTPVPVPEAQIPKDFEFAATDDIDKALSKAGDQLKIDAVPDFDEKPKVDVESREQEPDMYEFVAVEQEPTIDLGELKKRIVYPEMAKRAGVEGKVVIRVLVGKNGKPKKTHIESSDNELLNKAAINAVMQSEFSPAIQNRIPIDCWVSIPITFQLR